MRTLYITQCFKLLEKLSNQLTVLFEEVLQLFSTRMSIKFFEIELVVGLDIKIKILQLLITRNRKFRTLKFGLRRLK
jgi:hypothetical protein